MFIWKIITPYSNNFLNIKPKLKIITDIQYKMLLKIAFYRGLKIAEITKQVIYLHV